MNHRLFMHSSRLYVVPWGIYKVLKINIIVAILKLNLNSHSFSLQYIRLLCGISYVTKMPLLMVSLLVPILLCLS